ncbi:MAG: PKD domain-containing protein [Planctomycetes bacterium]|nr:PKD domain-containing protein [Planctomycetota bacterium]
MERLEDRTLLSAVVATGQPEYEPGQVVEISASGFQAGETIEFMVLAAGSDPSTAELWQVSDGGAADIDGAVNEVVVSFWELPEAAADGQSYDISVRGLTDAGTAQTQITTVVVASKATVQTDKLDYMPMETAVITASGFGVGEAVEFQVLHIDGTPNTGHGHDPWQVIDGSTSDLDGHVDGNVTTTWYVHEDDSLGAAFGLSAAGLTSETSAWTSFTDGNDGLPSGSLLVSDDFSSGFGADWLNFRYNADGTPWATIYPDAVITDSGAADPPSAPYAVMLNGWHESLYSRSIDLRGYTTGAIVYDVQAGGNRSAPDPEDHLTLEYVGASGGHTLRREQISHFGSTREWHRHVVYLPEDAFHQFFKLGFSATDSDQVWVRTGFLSGYWAPDDHWFIDNVQLYVNAPPAITLTGPEGTVLSSTHPTFSWGISDIDGNVTSASVKVTKDGAEVYSRSYTGNVSNESFALNPFDLGSYVITISARDAAGATSSESRTVNVINTPPNAVLSVATPPESRLEGSAITFDASGSTDFEAKQVRITPDQGPVVTYDLSALTFVWNFGDGTLARGLSTSHAYADNGTYTARLTVVDAHGDVSVATQTVVVENVVPAVTASAPTSVNEAAPFELTVSGPVDPGRDETALTVDWGDGITETFASGGVLRHVYRDGGVRRTVRVFHSDEDATYSGEDVTDVDVLNAAPVVTLPAFFTAQAGGQIFFAPTVVDSPSDTLTYAWEFGDDTYRSGADLDAVFHAYAADGVYPVSLTVTDSDGLSTTVTSQVVIGSPVSFTAASQTVGEGGSVTITAHLESATALGHDVVIPLVVSGASADYSLSAAQIIIAAGSLSGSVTLGARQDPLDEDDEELIVRMGLPTGASHGAVAEQRVTVVDDDAKPTVFFTSRSRTVDEGLGTLVLTAGLSAASGRDVVVPVSLSGTALAGEDYALPGRLEIVIAAGSLTGSLELRLIDDSRMEGAETILVSMLASGQADLSTEAARPTSVSFIIPQNDAPVVSLDSAYRLTAEGVPAIYVRARLSRISEERITVPFTISGTASNGLDYEIATSSLVFLPGADEASVVVTITDDQLVEGTENVLIELSAPANAILGPSQAVLTDILDNDIVRVSFEPGSVTEWEGGVVPVKVKLSNASTKSVTVPILVSGTAADGNDFTLSTTQLVLSAEATEGLVYVTLTDDAANEPPEWLYLSFGDIVGGVPGEQTTKAITISDNDPLVSLSPSSRSITEGGGTVRFMVSLSSATNHDVTVPLQYSGAARRGTDYDGSLSVVIPEGSMSAQFTLTITDDAEIEPAETIDVALGAPAGGVLGRPNAVSLALQDNDKPSVYWDVQSRTVAEEDGTATLTVRLSQPAFSDVSVVFEVASQEAAAGSDYRAEQLSALIPQGQTTASFLVLILNDDVQEPTESFTVSITSATGAALPADPSLRRATVTVLDSDKLSAAEVDAVNQQVTSSIQKGGGAFPFSLPAIELQIAQGLPSLVPSPVLVDRILQVAGTVSSPPWSLGPWTLQWLREEYPGPDVPLYINSDAVAHDWEFKTDQFLGNWAVAMGQKFVAAWLGSQIADLMIWRADYSFGDNIFGVTGITIRSTPDPLLYSAVKGVISIATEEALDAIKAKENLTWKRPTRTGTRSSTSARGSGSPRAARTRRLISRSGSRSSPRRTT